MASEDANPPRQRTHRTELAAEAGPDNRVTPTGQNIGHATAQLAASIAAGNLSAAQAMYHAAIEHGRGIERAEERVRLRAADKAAADEALRRWET